MTLYMTLKKTLLKHPKFFDKQKLDKAFFSELRKECKKHQDTHKICFKIGYCNWTIADRFLVEEIVYSFRTKEKLHEHDSREFYLDMIPICKELVLLNLTIVKSLQSL